MTLVIASITPHFAILATDRRIQWSRIVYGQRSIVAEGDSDTKSAIVDRRYIMGFAGLGRFYPGGSANTDRGFRVEGWLLDQLRETKSGEHFDVIADRFGATCEMVGYAGPHKFVAVGFEGDAATPSMVTIANSRRFVHTFDIVRKELGGAPFLLETAGEVPDVRIVERLKQNLTYLQAWDASQPMHLHERFVGAIRKVAKTSEGRVGDVVTVTSLPRSAIPADVGVTSYFDRPGPEEFRAREVSWTYWPDGSSIQEHPARVCAEAVLGGIGSAKSPEVRRGPVEGLFVRD